MHEFLSENYMLDHQHRLLKEQVDLMMTDATHNKNFIF